MPETIKLSSPATREFWEIEVLFEDEHLLALNKPPGLSTSPESDDPKRPNLLTLLHQAIAEGKPWTKQRGLTYLANAHRLDTEASGVLLLARSKPVLVTLANYFSSGKPGRIYVALVQGAPAEPSFEVEAKLGPHPARPAVMRVDPKKGKRCRTQFEVRERFDCCTLLQCRPLTERLHQIRVHLRHVHLPIHGDSPYGGRFLLLSQLKSGYHLKAGREERPLIATAALHAESLALRHPVTGAGLNITAPLPKDFAVALKYLRRFALPPAVGDPVAGEPWTLAEPLPPGNDSPS